MNKISCYCLLIVLIGITFACSSSERPGEAAEKYAGYIVNGEYEQFAEIIAYDENATEAQIDEQKKLAVSLLQETGKKIDEERNGLKSSVVLSEVISADEKNATVILNQTFGNGDTDSSTFKMVKRGGKWKIIL